MTPVWLALALAQAAAAPPTGPAPQRFSILAEPCPTPPGDGDVVVCARPDANRLPLPDDAPPVAGYVKPDSGDYRDNQLGPTPCAALMAGCQVGSLAIMLCAAAGTGGSATR